MLELDRPKGNESLTGLAGRRRTTLFVLAAALALVLGALAGLAAIPAVFARTPHDLRRIGVLLAALRDTDPPPSVIVFGNSIAMCGIDGGLLERKLGNGTRALNFSSTGQTLAEGLLYYHQLDPATRAVVYAVSPPAVETGVAFNPHVYNAFLLSGYELDPWTRDVLEDAFPEPLLKGLDSRRVEQLFDGRWVVRTAIDASLRRLIRRDLALMRADTDLQFPAPYTTKVAPTVLEGELKRLIGSRRPGPMEPLPMQTRVIERIVERAAQDGRRVVLALTPVHPRLRAALGASYLTPLRDLAAGYARAGAEVVDSSELLGEDGFIDSLHPTPEGAERWTAALATALDGTL